MFEEFPRSEYKRRVDKASNLMEAQGIDALVLTSQESIRYFAGGPLTEFFNDKFNFFFLILPKDSSIEPALVMSSGREGACRTSWIRDRRFWGYGDTGSMMDQNAGFSMVAEAMREKGLNDAVLGLELDTGLRLGMTQAEVQVFMNMLSKAKVRSASDIIWKLRSVKSEAEVRKIKKACEITCDALQKALDSIKAGMSEKELAGIIRSTMFQNGATGEGFLSILSGAERMMWADAIPSDYRMKKGDLVIMDGGCSLDGYHADVLRVASIGHPRERVKELFAIAREANHRIIEAFSPGVRISKVCEIGRHYIERQGAGELLVFGAGQTGHGLGLNLHELPDLRLDSKALLEEGMVTSVEPAITDLPGWTNAKSFFVVENNLAVTSEGHEVLTPLADDLWIV